MSLLHKDTHKENYTLSLLLWSQLNMCPPHVARETIRKFPKLHKVTSDLIIVTINKQLAIHKYTVISKLLVCRPTHGEYILRYSYFFPVKLFRLPSTQKQEQHQRLAVKSPRFMLFVEFRSA